LNEYFRIREKRLLCEIQHHKISTSPVLVTTPVMFAAATTPMKKQIISSSNSSQEQVLSMNSSPTTVLVDLIDENEMPRKEKLQLIKELPEIKSLCNNIFTSFNQEK
jgi:heat shock transcription factor